MVHFMEDLLDDPFAFLDTVQEKLGVPYFDYHTVAKQTESGVWVSALAFASFAVNIPKLYALRLKVLCLAHPAGRGEEQQRKIRNQPVPIS